MLKITDAAIFWRIWNVSNCRNWTNWATTWENLFLPYANNKGADQSVHLRSLISTFVVGYIDNIIPILAKSKISTLASFWSRPGRSESYLVENPEDRFSRDEAPLMDIVWWSIHSICLPSLLKRLCYNFKKAIIRLKTKPDFQFGSDLN